MKYYFYIFTSLGLSIYTLQKLQVSLPQLINNYVNDFLIIPIVLMLSLFVIRELRNDKTYKLSIGIIFYTCVLYSVIFEYYLPKIQIRYTTDVIDVVLYFFGGAIFYIIQSKYTQS